MKALSVKQPYAEMIASGSKKREFRTWKTSHKGDLLIVASSTVHDDYATNKTAHTLPRSTAIAIVTVTGYEVTCDGYAWILESPRRVKPFFVKGFASLYNVDGSKIQFASTPNASNTLFVPLKDQVVRVSKRAPKGVYTLEIETKPGSNRSKPVPGIFARTKDEAIEKGEALGNENPGRAIYVMSPHGFCAVPPFAMVPQ